MYSLKHLIPAISLLLALIVIPQHSDSQSVSINTTANPPNTNSMLDISSNSKGLLIPRLSTAQRTGMGLAAADEGMTVYDTDTKSYWLWDGTAWVEFDMDPTNEYNTSFTLTGTTLEITDGAGTLSQDISGLTDSSYWERDKTNGYLFPKTISDNVGIGDQTPEGKLDVHGRTYIAGDGDAMTDNAPELDLTIDDDATGSNTGFEVPGPDTLAFYAGGTEQARIFPDGVMAVNAVPGAGTHTFYSGADAGGGDHAITGVVTGSGVGVFGQSLGGTGSAVVGIAANANAYAVEGVNVADDGGGAIFQGDDFGAAAVADSIPGGIGLRAGGNGMNAIGPMPGAGVSGFAKDIGLWGAADSIAGTGVVGVGNGLTTWTSPTQGAGAVGNGVDFGVFGKADSVPGGIGIYGVGNNITTFTTPPATVGAGVAGNGSDRGVHGVADNSGSGIGVFGVGNGIGAYTSPANGAGVGGVGTEFGVWGRADNTASSTWGGYFENDNTYAYVGGTDAGGTNHKIQGPGNVSTIVENEQGEEVAMFATESPEVLFEDHGQGTLKDGKARIELDPTWAKNVKVDNEHPLRVFVQVEGNCKGVYVTDKNENGFTVKELQGGDSDVPFTYRVVANRKNTRIEFENGRVFKSKTEDVRFPDAMQPAEIERQKHEKESGKQLERKSDEDPDLNKLDQVPENSQLER